MRTSSTDLRPSLRRKESLNVMLLQGALQKVKDSEMEKLEDQNISVEDLLHAQKEGELRPWLKELNISRTARMQISSAIASLPPSPTSERADGAPAEPTPAPITTESTASLGASSSSVPLSSTSPSTSIPSEEVIRPDPAEQLRGRLRRQGSILSTNGSQSIAVPGTKAAILPADLVVNFDQKLGTGCFGEVWRGTWNNKVVAVKLVNLSAPEDRQEFLDQIARADSIRHPNIVSYYGTSILQLGAAQHACLVMEFITPGSLVGVLKANKKKVSAQVLSSICSDVTVGLKHLHSRGIVHGDLALHNILVSGDINSDNYEIKVTAFGLSNEVLKGKEYYKISPDTVLLSPVKWRAPELLVDTKSPPTKSSDMWSLAVVFWEVFNFGDEPYEEIADDDVIKQLQSGTRLNKPDLCPQELYDEVLAKCWYEDPNKRPSARDVVTQLNNLELSAAGVFTEEEVVEGPDDDDTSRVASPVRTPRLGSPTEYSSPREPREQKEEVKEKQDSTPGSPRKTTQKILTIKKGVSWGCKSNGKLNIPADISINASGQVIVCGRWLESVQVFDMTGASVASFGSSGSGDGQFTGVTGIAVDEQERIYVTETTVFGLGKRRVQAFDKDGEFIFQFGSKGQNLGEFKEPRGIAVDKKGNIIVADSGNNRIQIFAPDGKFVGEFGHKGKKDGMLKAPWGIVTNSVGNILVTDKGNHRVQMFDSLGNFLYVFGKKGPKRGEFNEPRGIAVDKYDNIIVSDTMNERIQIFDRRGKYLKSLKVGLPYGVDVSPDGRILVCNTRRCVIQVIEYTVDNER